MRKLLVFRLNILQNHLTFEILDLKREIFHKKIDIRNLKNIKKLIKSSRPDFIFHLAAQSLVKKSYNYYRNCND